MTWLPRLLELAEKATKIDVLTRYFARGVGHTHAAIHGLKATGGILIIANHSQRKHLPRDIRTVTLDEIPEGIVCQRCPILVDNHALEVMASEVRQKDRFMIAMGEVVEAARVFLNDDDDFWMDVKGDSGQKARDARQIRKISRARFRLTDALTRLDAKELE